jgi:phosphate-selective porin OprO and OprP
MRTRLWAVALTAVGLVGAAASAQTAIQPVSVRPPLTTVPPPAPPVYIPRPTTLPPTATSPTTAPADVPAPPVVTESFGGNGPPAITELPSTNLSSVPVGTPSPGPIPGTIVTQAPVSGQPAVIPGVTLPAPSAPCATPGATINPEDWIVKFKFKPGDEHLLQMETSNGLFKFYAGGRLQIDGAWMATTDTVQTARALGGIGKLDDAVNFRRARFDFGGTFNRNIDFLMEFDFINTFDAERTGVPLPANTPVPTDLFVTFKNVPYVGNLRIGNQKPPIAMEHMTSSRFLNFMERSLPFDAFIENQDNGFEPGILVFDNAFDQRMYWGIGVFKNTRSIFGWNVGDGEYDLTARVTYLPVWENDGEYVVHTGIGGSCRDMDDDQERMRARTLIRNGPAILHNIIAEERLFADSRYMLVPEFAVIWGPWQFAAEYYAAWVTEATAPITGTRRTNFGTAYFQGAYVELLYFLTGEHRPYDRSRGALGRVIPNEDFYGFGPGKVGDCQTCDGSAYGWGAWQVGARYSFLDLDFHGLRGGTIHDITLGLNWYLNPYMKWQWNAIAEYRNAPNPRFDGWIYGFGSRIALDF